MYMSKIKIAIIGLGYLSLPHTKLFATKSFVIGFDIYFKRAKRDVHYI
jgi:UDP-N-acetyl-D-mannosaminuronate dehydrogenase